MQFLAAEPPAEQHYYQMITFLCSNFDVIATAVTPAATAAKAACSALLEKQQQQEEEEEEEDSSRSYSSNVNIATNAD